VYKLVLNK